MSLETYKGFLSSYGQLEPKAPYDHFRRRALSATTRPPFPPTHGMKLLRFIMGIGIILILVPAMALVLPEQLAAVNPFDSDNGVTRGLAIAADAPGPIGGPFSPEGIKEVAPEPEGSATGSSLPAAPEEQVITKSKSSVDPSTSSSSSADQDESSDTSSPSTTAKKPTTTEGHDDDDSPGSVVTEGTITGDACPCQVTGSAELRGDVNLKGDLMVMGGTLVARPGVTVKGNGFQIMFMDGGKADFQGSKTSTWSGNGSNANLSRDVQFHGLRRIMFHEGAGPSTLRYISVIDSGVNSVLGDYPLHWHRNGNSTRGTLVEGVVVLNGRHHAFVPHASHGITFRDVIAKKTLEEAFWWDKPGDPPACPKGDDSCTANDSHDIKVSRLLVDGVDSTRKYNYELSGVQLGQGSGNSMVNSLVRNVASGSSCSAYHWPEDANGDWEFRGNTATAGPCETAIFVWQNINGGGSRIDDFTTNGAVDHGAYRNLYAYDGVTASMLRSHAVSYTVKNASFDEIVFHQHPVEGEPVRFTNVNADRVTLSDADGKRGTYIFDGTNLSCEDVDFAKPHPSSKVVINGQEC